MAHLLRRDLSLVAEALIADERDLRAIYDGLNITACPATRDIALRVLPLSAARKLELSVFVAELVTRDLLAEAMVPEDQGRVRAPELQAEGE